MTTTQEDQARRQSTLFLTGEIIDSLRRPPAFWDAFRRVKFDTDDSEGYDGERILVIVAKGEAADDLAALYDGNPVG